MRELTDEERWEILRRYSLEFDPVIEAYEKDVDRTLLRENLRRSPEERCRNFASMTEIYAESQRLRRMRKAA